MRLSRVIPALLVLCSAGASRAHAQGKRSTPTVQHAGHQVASAPFRCDSAVLRSLIGRQVDEKSVHSAITEQLGASPIDDEPDSGIDGVAICGKEVQLLLHDERIEDAIIVPTHSRRYPQAFGYCTKEGHKFPGLVYSILDKPDQELTNKAKYAVDDTVHLTPTVAWRVDVRQWKLVPLELAGLKCARSDIFTADGGL